MVPNDIKRPRGTARHKQSAVKNNAKWPKFHKNTTSVCKPWANYPVGSCINWNLCRVGNIFGGTLSMVFIDILYLSLRVLKLLFPFSTSIMSASPWESHKGSLLCELLKDRRWHVGITDINVYIYIYIYIYMYIHIYIHMIHIQVYIHTYVCDSCTMWIQNIKKYHINTHV